MITTTIDVEGLTIEFVSPIIASSWKTCYYLNDYNKHNISEHVQFKTRYSMNTVETVIQQFSEIHQFSAACKKE